MQTLVVPRLHFTSGSPATTEAYTITTLRGWRGFRCQSTVTFYGVSWKFDDSEALMVGANGTIARYDGTNVTLLSSGFTNTIYAVSWNPVNGVALLAGNATDENGLLAQYDGSKFTRINATRIFPHKDPYVLYAIDWSPTGSYALIAGSWATLYRYDSGTLTQIN